MVDNIVKHIGEGKLSESPDKKLSLQIKDGSVTFDKLNEEVTNTIDFLDTTVEALADSKADKSSVYNVFYTNSTLKKQNINSGPVSDIVTASTIVSDGGGIKGVKVQVGSISGELPKDSEKKLSLTLETAPYENSLNPITSGAVYTALQDKGTYSKPAGGIPMNDLSQSVQDAIAAGGGGVEVIELNGYMSSTSWQDFHSSQELCNDVISAYQNGKQVVLTYDTTDIRVTIPIQFPYAQSATGTVVYMLPWSGSGVALSQSGGSVSSASNYMYFISGDGNGNIYTQIFILSPNVK